MIMFEYNGGFYEITQQKYEPRELFMERVWFILPNLEKVKTVEEYNDLIKESLIWINEKKLGCQYVSK